MTDTGASTGRGRRPWWGIASLVLSVLLLGLVAAIGITVARSDEGRAALDLAATDWGAPETNDLTRAHQDVARAAEAETTAFLTVDYRNMDPLVDAVLAGATGEFHQQYSSRREQLVQAARQNKSVSTGHVVALGVGDMDEDSALVYVAANSEVENVSTQGTRQPRYYRLQLDMTLVDGAWLASSVKFVG